MRFSAIESDGRTTGLLVECASSTARVSATLEARNHSGPIFDANGNQIGTLTMEMRDPVGLPPQQIPADYDPSTLKRGGCCDPPGDE